MLTNFLTFTIMAQNSDSFFELKNFQAPKWQWIIIAFALRKVRSLRWDIIIFNLGTVDFKAYCAIWVRRSNFRH